MEPLPQLTTDRLLLRPFDAADAPAVERLAGAREVADTTLSIPHPYPAGGGAAWIATHAAAWSRRSNLSLAVCLVAAPRDVVGAINLQLTMAHSHGELGYWIGLPSWGQGFATEAARALTDYGFGQLGLHRVQGHHFTRNPASGRVMQKLGMRFEGVHREAYLRWGRFEDVASYAILDTDRPSADSSPQDTHFTGES